MFNLKKISRIVTLNFILCFIFSCAHFTTYGRFYLNAKKAYSRGNYDQAINECIASLRYNYNYEPSYELLKSIFPKTINFHHKKIDRLKVSRDYYKWDTIVNELEILLTLIDNIESFNFQEILKSVTIRNYYEELQEAKLNAAESHYKSGLQKMESEFREEIRNAAIEFKKALSFIIDYKDSQNLYEICRESASIKLGILPFENNSGKKKYGSLGNSISNEVISRLINNKSLMEFIDIINREQINLIIDEQKLSHSGLINDTNSIELGQIAGINMMVLGEITQLIVNNPKKTVEKNVLKKKVISSTETYTDSDGNKQKKYKYKNVRGTVKIYNQEANTKIVGSYQIIDTKTAEILFSGNIEGDYNYSYNWATFTGDQRVLDYRTKMLTKKDAKSPPDKDQMVYSALEKLIDNFYIQIKSSLQ